MASYNSNSVPSDLNLYKTRQQKIYLTWCSQAIRLIQKIFPKNNLSINDIGRNYGQLYKEIIRKNYLNKFKYNGYDYDNTFLKLAKKYYSKKIILKNLNIENQTPDQTDITVCSALLEHCDNYDNALNNMIISTNKLIIIRTFCSFAQRRHYIRDSRFVSKGYNINIFSYEYIRKRLSEGGFKVSFLTDLATNYSQQKEVFKGSGIFRRIFFIVGLK